MKIIDEIRFNKETIKNYQYCYENDIITNLDYPQKMFLLYQENIELYRELNRKRIHSTVKFKTQPYEPKIWLNSKPTRSMYQSNLTLESEVTEEIIDREIELWFNQR